MEQLDINTMDLLMIPTISQEMIDSLKVGMNHLPCGVGYAKDEQDLQAAGVGTHQAQDEFTDQNACTSPRAALARTSLTGWMKLMCDDCVMFCVPRV